MVGFGFRGHIVALVSQEFCGDRMSLVWLVWSKARLKCVSVLVNSIPPYSGSIELVLDFGLEPGCLNDAF